MDNNKLLKTIWHHKECLESNRILVGSILDKVKKGLWHTGFIALLALLGSALHSSSIFMFIGIYACIMGFTLNGTMDYFSMIIYKIDKELEEINKIMEVYNHD